jgi:O-acetyl-ADP-ribose deacetylase (regulator of RNase III)
MITETKGNLLEAKTEALVNAVNCVGVMGKGIALQFRREFSEDYFKDYKRACQSGELAIGKVHVYELKTPKFDAPVSAFSPRFIVNFPTKNHWREQSRITDIESGLQSLVEAIKENEIKSMAMPALGCGLGGLDYAEVKPLIEEAFVHLPNVKVLLFVPK